MCRLLGIVSAEAIPYRILLRETPKSLSFLSKEHPDGWGMAVYRGSLDPNEAPSDHWTLHKGIYRAEKDEAFHQISSKISGEILISHIRRRTVGPISFENTHPFEREGWVFAHNGTIKDLDYLRGRLSPSRLGEIHGETDSELFFAYLLSCLDEGPPEESDEILKEAVDEAVSRPGFGELTFLLSNGRALYAFRREPKSLFLLERRPHEGEQYRLTMDDGKVFQMPWTRRRHAFFIASEKMTAEPWVDLEEKTLLKIDRLPKLSCRRL